MNYCLICDKPTKATRRDTMYCTKSACRKKGSRLKKEGHDLHRLAEKRRREQLYVTVVTDRAEINESLASLAQKDVIFTLQKSDDALEELVVLLNYHPAPTATLLKLIQKLAQQQGSKYIYIQILQFLAQDLGLALTFKQCKHCRSFFLPSGLGRPRIYCSPKCKNQKHYRSTLQGLN